MSAAAGAPSSGAFSSLAPVWSFVRPVVMYDLTSSGKGSWSQQQSSLVATLQAVGDQQFVDVCATERATQRVPREESWALHGTLELVPVHVPSLRRGAVDSNGAVCLKLCEEGEEIEICESDNMHRSDWTSWLPGEEEQDQNERDQTERDQDEHQPEAGADLAEGAARDPSAETSGAAAGAAAGAASAGDDSAPDSPRALAPPHSPAASEGCCLFAILSRAPNRRPRLVGWELWARRLPLVRTSGSRSLSKNLRASAAPQGPAKPVGPLAPPMDSILTAAPAGGPRWKTHALTEAKEHGPPTMDEATEAFVTQLTFAHLGLRGSVTSALPIGVGVSRAGLRASTRAAANAEPPAAGSFVFGERADPAMIPGRTPSGCIRSEAFVPESLHFADLIGSTMMPSDAYLPPNASGTVDYVVPAQPLMAPTHEIARLYAEAFLRKHGPAAVVLDVPALDRLLDGITLAQHGLVPALDRLAALPRAVLQAPHSNRSVEALPLIFSLMGRASPQLLGTLVRRVFGPDVRHLLLYLPALQMRTDSVLRTVLAAWLGLHEGRRAATAGRGTPSRRRPPPGRTASQLIVYNPPAESDAFAVSAIIRNLALAVCGWAAPASEPFHILPVSVGAPALFDHAQDVDPQHLGLHASLPAPAPLLRAAVHSLRATKDDDWTVRAQVRFFREMTMLSRRHKLGTPLPRLMRLFKSPAHLTLQLAAQCHRFHMSLHVLAERRAHLELEIGLSLTNPAAPENVASRIERMLSLQRGLERRTARVTEKSANAKRALVMWLKSNDEEEEAGAGPTELDAAVEAMLQPPPNHGGWRQAACKIVAMPVPRHCYSCLDDDITPVAAFLRCGHRLCARCIHHSFLSCSFCRQGDVFGYCASPDTTRHHLRAISEVVLGAPSSFVPPAETPSLVTNTAVWRAMQKDDLARLRVWMREMQRAASAVRSRKRAREGSITSIASASETPSQSHRVHYIVLRLLETSTHAQEPETLHIPPISRARPPWSATVLTMGTSLHASCTPRGLTEMDRNALRGEIHRLQRAVLKAAASETPVDLRLAFLFPTMTYFLSILAHFPEPVMRRFGEVSVLLDGDSTQAEHFREWMVTQPGADATLQRSHTDSRLAVYATIDFSSQLENNAFQVQTEMVDNFGIFFESDEDNDDDDDDSDDDDDDETFEGDEQEDARGVAEPGERVREADDSDAEEEDDGEGGSEEADLTLEDEGGSAAGDESESEDAEDDAEDDTSEGEEDDAEDDASEGEEDDAEDDTSEGEEDDAEDDTSEGEEDDAEDDTSEGEEDTG